MTLSVRPTMAVACAVVTLPVLIGIGAAWKARLEVAHIVASHQTLEAENSNYRSATQALSDQIAALQLAVADLGESSELDPALTRAMDRLPAIVKSRAMGGGGAAASPSAMQQSAYTQALSALASPDDTFGLLRIVLEGLESRLRDVRTTVERRNALAAATPSIWPAHGWISSGMGPRRDPITGRPDYHAGLDIAGDRGQPVYATAAGRVTHAGYQGNYGNLIVIDHGFGLETKYGHLARFSVKQGDQVKRGDVIGALGATGRATGAHLHYEVRANGRLLNPLQLLTQQKPRAQ